MMKSGIEELAKREKWERYNLNFLEGMVFGGWRVESDTCRFVGSLCERLRPRNVLEFGSGLSTLVLAHEASKGNIERIWSLDHLGDFPAHPRDILAAKGKERLVNFCKFPLKLRYLAGKFFIFYSIPRSFFERIGLLDLIIVDGPPYYYNGREAALYTVYPYLSPKGLVLLDDANRKNREQVYLKNWRSYFGGNIDSAIFLHEFKKGLACVWLTGHEESISKFRLNERLKDSWISLTSMCFSILRDKKCLR